MTQHQERATPSESERDALDHIMRVARATIQPTRRLDWIALRAQYALEGKPWSRDIRETPNDRVRERERLRERLAAAQSHTAELEGYAQRQAKALEFAEYLAKSAEGFHAATNQILAYYAEDEEPDDASWDAFSDHSQGLRNSIYEFRKRAARAQENGG